MGARELSLTTTGACSTSGPSAAVQGGLHASPVDSEGAEFFDAYDTFPWSPERPRPARLSPAAVAARAMQLALWPEDTGSAEKPHDDEWEVSIGIDKKSNMTSGPLTADVEETEVGGRGGNAGARSLNPNSYVVELWWEKALLYLKLCCGVATPYLSVSAFPFRLSPAAIQRNRRRISVHMSYRPALVKPSHVHVPFSSTRLTCRAFN